MGVYTRAAKNDLYDGFALVGKALASGRRLEILDLLAQGAMSVEAIAGQIDQSIANTSQHLQVLSTSGLVSSTRSGRQVLYSAAPGAVGLAEAVRRVALEQIDALEQLVSSYLGERDDIELITRSELRRRLRRHSAILIDVRPRADFESGHIPGALSIPVEELASRASELPSNSTIVAYCRGPFCALGDRAVRELRKYGVTAVRLEDGFPEWQREENRV